MGILTLVLQRVTLANLPAKTVCRYEQLVTLHPNNEDYKLYYAQSLYKVRGSAAGGLRRAREGATLFFAITDVP